LEIDMKKGMIPPLLAAILVAVFTVSSGVKPASAGSVTFTQAISPADGVPVVTSTHIAPAGLSAALLSQTIDWSTLGFSADPTLDFDNTALADAGPTSDTLADPPASGGMIIVGNDPITCPDAQYSTIQAAVTAANPGAHIMVCPGTYVEQVLIPAGRDNLVLQSQHPLQAVIQAPTLMTSPKAIVRVNAQSVDIQQFTIQGPGSGGCDSLEEGVFVDQGGSAVIEHNHITHIRDNPLSGCQNGLAVLIGRKSMSTTGTATVSHNTIDDFQKGGIVVDNSGSNGDIEKNIVKGVGPTILIAANGIQISRGATGVLKNNEVSGNVYTPGTVTSTGILLFQSGTTDVENNKVHDNDTGIYAYVSATTVEKNAVVRSTYDGITVDTSQGAQVQHNKTEQNDQGIGVYGTMNAMLDNNQAKDNGSNGFFADSGTSSNTFQDNKASGSGLFDCRDDSTGTGTAGTANSWLNDMGQTSMPTGICQAS
jgi:parallel beta-helix repeat protein